MTIPEWDSEGREKTREIVITEGDLHTGGYAYGQERGFPQMYNDKSRVAEPTLIFSVDGIVKGKQKIRIFPRD